jgi:hypothetical protein
MVDQTYAGTGIGVGRRQATDGGRQDRVFVAVEASACTSSIPTLARMETIERTDVVLKAAAFGFEHPPDCLHRLFRITVGLA